MPAPEDDLAALHRFCKELTPPEHGDEMRIDMTVDGDRVTLGDARPPWDGSPGAWTSAPFAQLRYSSSTKEWTLWWADSDDRWHRYEQLGPTSDIRLLLGEIAEDPTSIFFG